MAISTGNISARRLTGIDGGISNTLVQFIRYAAEDIGEIGRGMAANLHARAQICASDDVAAQQRCALGDISDPRVATEGFVQMASHAWTMLTSLFLGQRASAHGSVPQPKAAADIAIFYLPIFASGGALRRAPMRPGPSMRGPTTSLSVRAWTPSPISCSGGGAAAASMV